MGKSRNTPSITVAVPVPANPELPGEPTERQETFTGRIRQTFLRLKEAGPLGCTPLENPALRWSHYIHQLRHEHGIIISTEMEPHGGEYPGNHARYRLEMDCRIISDDGAVSEGEAA